MNKIKDKFNCSFTNELIKLESKQDEKESYKLLIKFTLVSLAIEYLKSQGKDTTYQAIYQCLLDHKYNNVFPSEKSIIAILSMSSLKPIIDLLVIKTTTLSNDKKVNMFDITNDFKEILHDNDNKITL